MAAGINAPRKRHRSRSVGHLPRRALSPAHQLHPQHQPRPQQHQHRRHSTGRRRGTRPRRSTAPALPAQPGGLLLHGAGGLLPTHQQHASDLQQPPPFPRWDGGAGAEAGWDVDAAACSAPAADSLLAPAARNPGGAESSGDAARQIAVLRGVERSRELYAGRLRAAAHALQPAGRAALVRAQVHQAWRSMRMREGFAARAVQRAWRDCGHVRAVHERRRLLALRAQNKVFVLRRWRAAAWGVGGLRRQAACVLQGCCRRLRPRWRCARRWAERRRRGALRLQCLFRRWRATRERLRLEWFRDAWRYRQRAMAVERRAIVTEERRSALEIRRRMANWRWSRPRSCGDEEGGEWEEGSTPLFVTNADLARAEEAEAEARAVAAQQAAAAWLRLTRAFGCGVLSVRAEEEGKAARILRMFDEQVRRTNGGAVVGGGDGGGSSSGRVPQPPVRRSASALWCRQGTPVGGGGAASVGQRPCRALSASVATPPPPRRRGVSFALDRCARPATGTGGGLTHKMAAVARELWGREDGWQQQQQQPQQPQRLPPPRPPLPPQQAGGRAPARPMSAPPQMHHQRRV